MRVVLPCRTVFSLFAAGGAPWTDPVRLGSRQTINHSRDREDMRRPPLVSRHQRQLVVPSRRIPLPGSYRERKRPFEVQGYSERASARSNPCCSVLWGQEGE